MTYIPGGGSGGGGSISGSSDVALDRPIHNHVLSYNGDLQKWQNAQLVPNIKGTGITEIIKLTQAEYDAITTKIDTTLYVIQG